MVAGPPKSEQAGIGFEKELPFGPARSRATAQQLRNWIRVGKLAGQSTFPKSTYARSQWINWNGAFVPCPVSSRWSFPANPS